MTEPAADWNEFVGDHAAGHLLQTSEWAELKCRFGWRARRVLMPAADGGAARAGALILFRKSMGQVLAYVPRGPLVDWSDAALTEDVVARMCAVARQEGAFALKIEPDLLDTAANRQRLAAAGFHSSPQTIQPRSTVVVDLRADDDTILARMKSKWRYNIRLAARKGVTVRELQAHELPIFQQLMDETGTRDGFSVHSAAYYRDAYELLASRWGAFLLASYQGDPLASIAVFAIGSTAYYLWGASNNRHRNLMPNHALQWEAMRWAKARGCARYDLWGIPDEVGAVATGLWDEGRKVVLVEKAPVDVNAFPKGDLWGVFRFKQGFGGAVERTVGAWDLPLSRSIYGLYRGVLLAKDRAAAVQERVGSETQDGKMETARPCPPRARRVDLEPVTSEAAWEEMLAQLPPDSGHVLQSWAWGAVKAGSGWRVERWAVQRSGRLLGMFQFLWRQPIAPLPLRVAYVPKGPLLDWSDDEAAALVLAQIEELSRQRGCLQVKIDPDVAEENADGQRLKSLLAQRNWRFSPEQIQFKNTGFTEISQTDEAVAGLVQEQVALQHTAGTAPGSDSPRRRCGGSAGFLSTLSGDERARWLFDPPIRLLRCVVAYVSGGAGGPTGRAPAGALLLAEHPQEESPVAGLFLLRHGRQTLYFNGASSERRRRDMPNYLLQWRALQWAKAQGLHRL